MNGVNTGNVQANLKASSFNVWCKAESNTFMGKKKNLFIKQKVNCKDS